MLDFRTVSDLGNTFPEIEKTEKSRQPVIYNFLGVAKEKRRLISFFSISRAERV